MDIFGLKWSILIGEVAYILYICANIWPMPSVMYISKYIFDEFRTLVQTSSTLASAFVGLASAPFWTSQATYIGYIAHYYVYYKHKTVEVVVSLFFGIFFAIYNTCTIWAI